jgi:hypothetical protein
MDMFKKVAVLVVCISLGAASVSHAVGLFQYLFDGIKNQLGLDRGPVPKVVPENPDDPYCKQNPLALRPHPDRNRAHIQAQGF